MSELPDDRTSAVLPDPTRTTGTPTVGWSSAPIRLGPNLPDDRPYRGGAGIAAFRGLPADTVGPRMPEDFVGSVTEVHGAPGVGLTTLEPGLTLREAVRRDPVGFLGEQHVARFGAETMLLVKLLDTAERLFVHFHPGDRFAADALGEPRGKTEAWIVLAVADGVDGFAALGFDRDVTTAEAEAWFAGQDVDAMLAAMHRVPLRVGSTLLVPAGIPHAIGPGITLVELQQPADLSILLEYRGFPGLDASSALMGMSVDTAVAALDRRAWSAEDIAALSAAPRALRPGVTSVFPPEADRYFRAERIVVDGTAALEASFGILVVVAGSGRLEHGAGSMDLAAGDTVLVPYGVGAVDLVGQFEVVRALPPISAVD